MPPQQRQGRMVSTRLRHARPAATANGAATASSAGAAWQFVGAAAERRRSTTTATSIWCSTTATTLQHAAANDDATAGRQYAECHVSAGNAAAAVWRNATPATIATAKERLSIRHR